MGYRLHSASGIYKIYILIESLMEKVMDVKHYEIVSLIDVWGRMNKRRFVIGDWFSFLVGYVRERAGSI